MEFSDITPELRAKMSSATSPEELLRIAKEVGGKLSEDELKMISGGEDGWEDCVTVYGKCPKCHYYFEKKLSDRCPYCGAEIPWQ